MEEGVGRCRISILCHVCALLYIQPGQLGKKVLPGLFIVMLGAVRECCG